MWTHEKFHNAAQGVLAIVGVVAIIVGGILYYAERRDKPRVVLQPRATVVGITPEDNDGGRLDEVLLQVAVGIENRSSRGLTFNCAAIDIIGLSGSEGRAQTYTDDLAGRSLLPRLRETEGWANCRKFEAAWREKARELREIRLASADWVNPPLPTPEPRSGARYRDFFMEPGEITTKTWEQRVPCSFDAVRVLFKLPKPGSTQNYETKIVVPIADICSNERNVSILRFGATTPGVEGEQSGGEGSGAEDSTATPAEPS